MSRAGRLSEARARSIQPFQNPVCVLRAVFRDVVPNIKEIRSRLRCQNEPRPGHHREDVADTRHRFWTVYSYVMAYRDQTKPLEITAIVHGARRLEAFFERRIRGQASEAGK